MQRLKTPLTIAALILTGIGVLAVLERMGAPPDPAGELEHASEPGSPADAAASAAEFADDPAPSALLAGIPPGGSVLLAPPGTPGADLVLREDGGWERPAATRPAPSRPAESRPAELVLALPQSLPALTAKARASLAGFLESRRPRPVVTLPAAAPEADRDELRRLLEWLR